MKKNKLKHKQIILTSDTCFLHNEKKLIFYTITPKSIVMKKKKSVRREKQLPRN